MTERLLLLIPLPHVLLHCFHGVQLDTRQCTGQKPCRHCLISRRGRQIMPPYAAGASILRVRRIEPFPHVLVHSDHSLQTVRTQSTGHGRTLHFCCCSKDGQFRPPKPAASFTTRRLCFEPPPQVFEHTDHSVHGVTWQS